MVFEGCSVSYKVGFVTIWEGFGSHFQRLLGTLGDILVVWKGSETTVDCQWISGPPEGPPKSNIGHELTVFIGFLGPTNSY